MARDKCFVCNKLKTNVKVRDSNHKVCDNCAVKCTDTDNNPSVGDNGGSRSASTSDDIFDTNSSSADSVEALRKEIKCLQQTVVNLQQQVSFLLTFVGAVDGGPSPAADAAANSVINSQFGDVADANANVDDIDVTNTTAVPTLPHFETVVNRKKRAAKSIHHSALNAPLCQAVTTAVYLDMQNIELKAKNIIISGLDESADCSDKDLAMNLFSTEFAEQPNIVLIRRLGKRDLTDDRKVRPLLITFDNSHTAQHFIDNAKVLRSSNSVEIRDRVYINRDLTKAQSQAAYELRCRRRAAAAQRRSKQGDQPTSLSAAAKPFTPSDGN